MTGLRIAVAVLMVAVLAAAACAGDGESSSARMTLKAAGSTEGAPLGYVEYLPPGYGEGTLRPLLVFLHGTGEAGDGSAVALEAVFKLGIPRLIEQDKWPEGHPFVVLMPQYGVDVANSDCALADEIDAFLAFAIDRYDVDEDRVYLTGISCGAIGAWDYLAAHTDEDAAGAVLISGHAEDAFAQAGCDLGRVPIWAFHGANDQIVPEHVIADRIDELQACEPAPTDLRLTTYPDAGHDAWSRTYNLSAGHDVYAWLLEHERA